MIVLELEKFFVVNDPLLDQMAQLAAENIRHQRCDQSCVEEIDLDRFNCLVVRKLFRECQCALMIVDQFKSGLDGVKYPAYDGKELEETAAVFKKLVAEAEKLAEEAKKREIEIEAELKAIEEDKQKLATITMDEVFEREPALKAEVDERIRNDQWF